MSKGQTADLILEAGAMLIARAGPEGASVRTIAEQAGISAPALQHHFRSKASLLGGIYGQAVERHLALTAAALAPFAGLRLASEPLALRRKALAEMAASTIREWVCQGGNAVLSAVVLHLLVHAVRDPVHSALAQRWLAGTVAAFGMDGVADGEDAQFLVELLVGLALVSAPGAFQRESDVLNRELLAFACGLRGPGNGFWLDRFRARHEQPNQGAVAPAERGEVHAELLAAGVALTAEVGADALSYRKIAARANVAPSSALYHFPSRQALLTALYREVHRRFVGAAPSAREAEWTRLLRSGETAHLVAMFTRLIVEQMAGEAPLFLTSCELFLAGWREPELAPEALFMRLERGRFAWPERPEPREGLRAQTHSLWTIGLALTQYSHPSADRAGDIERRLRAGLRFLESGSAAA
jgi:AcrR family transcriptional regulator